MGDGRRDDDIEAPAGPAPVAALDELVSAAPDPVNAGAPVVRFDDERIGAARDGVPVAQLGRLPGRPDGSRRAEPPVGSARPVASRPAELPVRSDRRDGRSGPDRRAADDRPSGAARDGVAGPATGTVGPAISVAGRSGTARAQPAERQTEPEADPVAVALAICLRLLTERARSRHELAAALRRKGVADDVAGTVLDRFGVVGLVDDAGFAEQWVHSRHTGRGLGRRALAAELRRKGVADDLAGSALQDIDPAAEERRARQLVDRRLRSMGPLDDRKQRTVAARRLAGMLARKGYGAGVAYRVVREAIAAHGAETDDLVVEDGAVDEGWDG
jgi:regulatory protein